MNDIADECSDVNAVMSPRDSYCDLSPIIFPRDITLKGLRRIAADHDMPLQSILSRVRDKKHSAARVDCYSHLRARGMSYSQIGAIMGAREWSTVRDGLKGS